MGFNQGKFSNHKKINGTTMFAILFALFVLILGITAGLTYSGFQSTATSSGTLTFAVNGHQGTLNLTNTKVSGYNSQDLTLAFTLASEDNYHTPIITSITMGGTPLTQESTNFKSDSIVVATYSSNTLTINRANVTGNLIITGSSTASTYTIEYNSNSGVGTMNDTIANYNSFATLRANTFTRDGYTFAGWSTSASGDIVYVDSAPVKDLGNITLYAKWVANTNVITLNNQNALSTGSTSVVATYGNALPDITIPIKGAMIFDGYYTEQNGAGTQYYAGNGTSANNWAGTSDTTLYANWIYAIKFSSVNNITLKSNAESITWKQANGTNGLIEYKTDAEDWATWDGTIIGGAQGDETKNIYLRGTGNAKIAGSGNNWVLTGTNISCSGNIETLLDYATVAVGNHPIMITSCYDSMFYNCTNLVNAPVLPATTLVNSCYRSMFQGCTNLENVPELPATTLANECYYMMFSGCTSLISIPALPATTLADNCYGFMFQNCTSLTEVELGENVSNLYTYMFQGCTNLVSVTLLKSSAPIVTLSSASALPFSNSGFKVYVPKDLLSTYKAATNWSTYASQIYAMPYYMVGSMGYVTLAEAVAGASSGDTIYLKRDTNETINSTITINKNLTITSYGDIKQIDINLTGYTENLLAINSSYTLTISNITFNNASYYGRAIYINGGTLNINAGARIACFGGNNFSHGGAIWVDYSNGGIINMYGGSIENCSSSWDGGAISLDSAGSIFNMYDGVISGCSTYGGEANGGAVYVSNYAKFYMFGGILCNNYSQVDGGAVGVWDFGEFYMSGGTMYGNTAGYHGGAVHLFGSDDPSKFYMTGGTIYNATGTNSDTENGVFINWGELYYQPSNANQIGYLDISQGDGYNSAGTSDWTGINNHTGSWDGTWDPSILNN